MLWEEIRKVSDPEVRRGLLQRLAERLAAMYKDRLHGADLTERLASLRALFADRKVTIKTHVQDGLPVLSIVDCPYPDLAELDRGICALENMLFSELLDTDLRLSQCRLDGSPCCTFGVN